MSDDEVLCLIMGIRCKDDDGGDKDKDENGEEVVPSPDVARSDSYDVDLF